MLAWWLLLSQTYAGRPTLSRALCDFLVYHDRNYKKALELCAAATVANKYEDWCAAACFP